MEFVWVDLRYQPAGADVWVLFQGSGVLHCYLVPSSQFRAFEKGDAVDCFQFDVVPPQQVVQIPHEGLWHVVLDGVGEAEVMVNPPALPPENLRAVLQPEKHLDPTPGLGAPDLTQLQLLPGTVPPGDNTAPPSQTGWQNLLVPSVDPPGPNQPPLPIEQVINQINAPVPRDERFTKSERYIFSEIAKNRDSATVKDLQGLLSPTRPVFSPESLLGSAAMAGYTWAEKVKTQADWDHKPKIERLLGITSPDKLDREHRFPVPGNPSEEVLYDIYSNIHYGYIGRVSGFDTQFLIWGSGLNTAATGTNDDGDIITMAGGAALFDKYGPNMTAEEFHTGLMDIVDQLSAAKRAGKDVPQISYAP